MLKYRSGNISRYVPVLYETLSFCQSYKYKIMNVNAAYSLTDTKAQREFSFTCNIFHEINTTKHKEYVTFR